MKKYLKSFIFGLVALSSVGSTFAVGYNRSFGDDSTNIPPAQFDASQYKITMTQGIADFYKPVPPPYSSYTSTTNLYNSLIPENRAASYAYRYYRGGIDASCSIVSCYSRVTIQLSNAGPVDIALTDVLNFQTNTVNSNNAVGQLQWVEGITTPNINYIHNSTSLAPIITYVYLPWIGGGKYPYPSYQVIPAGGSRIFNLVIKHTGFADKLSGSYSANLVFNDGSQKPINSFFAGGSINACVGMFNCFGGVR